MFFNGLVDWSPFVLACLAVFIEGDATPVDDAILVVNVVALNVDASTNVAITNLDIASWSSSRDTSFAPWSRAPCRSWSDYSPGDSSRTGRVRRGSSDRRVARRSSI